MTTSPWEFLTFENAVQWGPPAASFVFAGIATFVNRRVSRTLFMSLFLESLVFIMGVIVIASLFFGKLFDLVERNSVYLQMMAMMTIIYAGRDVLDTLQHARDEPHENPK